MEYRGFFYIDKKGREIFHVPNVFVVINYMRREPEIILDLRRLGLWYNNWQKRRMSLQEIIGYPEVSSKDVEAIIGLLFDNKLQEAKDYCIDVFDQVVNEEFGINSESRRYRKCQ